MFLPLPRVLLHLLLARSIGLIIRSASLPTQSDYFIKYGVLKTLSPQQITSCTTTCYGCQGGNPINAWDCARPLLHLVHLVHLVHFLRNPINAWDCAQPRFGPCLTPSLTPSVLD